MKKQLVLLLFLFSSALAFSQTCYSLDFTYDASGNRTYRVLNVVSCEGGEKNSSGTSSTRDSLEAMKINVYPNPTKDKITIELSHLEAATESKISMYDINGKIMYSQTTSLERLQIDVSSFSSGNYYLEVRRGNKRAGFNVSKN